MLTATMHVVTTIPRDEPPSDVARAAAGDRQAFERVYRANMQRVFSICVRMSGDRARAEELTQDVFVRAWEKLPLIRGESARTGHQGRSRAPRAASHASGFHRA